MSDLMLMGVLRAPHDPSDYLAMTQLIAWAREAADEIERLKLDIERAQAAGAEMAAQLDCITKDHRLDGVETASNLP